jgi:hypothetical protein
MLLSRSDLNDAIAALPNKSTYMASEKEEERQELLMPY